MTGITRQGDSTEKKIEEMCPLISENEDKSAQGKAKGDLICKLPDGRKFYVESKKTTWNQTRPNKYIVCVGYHHKLDKWYVAPPHRLMYYASSRRGQHTPDPFQCIGFGTPNSTHAMWKEFLVQPNENLQDKIIQAYEQGEKNIEWKRYASQAKKLHENLAEQLKNEIPKELLKG